jgi:nitronate monooxygenase
MARDLPAGQLVEVLNAEIAAAETALSAAAEIPEEGAAR